MESKEQEHRYWSQKTSEYDDTTRFIMGAETLQEISDWLAQQIEPGTEILELGCGTGFFSEILATRARRLMATDLSDEMLSAAENRLRTLDNVVVQKEDGYELTFAEAAFDIVFMGNLLHVVGDPAQVLSEAARVLRPSGKLIVIDATTYGLPLLKRLGMISRYLRSLGMPPQTNKNLIPKKLAALVETAGFAIESSEMLGQETKSICLQAVKPADAQ